MTRTDKVGLFVLDLLIAMAIALLWTDLMSTAHLVWSAAGLFVLQMASWTGKRPWLIQFCSTALALFLPAIFIPWLRDQPILVPASFVSAMVTAWLLQKEFQERFQFCYLASLEILGYLASLLWSAFKDPNTRMPAGHLGSQMR